MKIRAAAAVLAAMMAVLFVGSGTAHAVSLWAHQDGFESSPESTWTLAAYGDSSGGFDLGINTARSGYNNAWLYSRTEFSSVGKTIHLTPAQFHNPQCAGRVYIQTHANVRINFEVIDPSTWSYVALETVDLPWLSGYPYQEVQVGPWWPGPIDVFVRISLIGNGGYSGVRVDDVEVQCLY